MVIPPASRLQQIVVTCPVTELPVSTGIRLSEAVFATAVFTNVRVSCPHCEGEHRWSKADAVLVDADLGAATPPRAFGRRAPR